MSSHPKLKLEEQHADLVENVPVVSQVQISPETIPQSLYGHHDVALKHCSAAGVHPLAPKLLVQHSAYDNGEPRYFIMFFFYCVVSNLLFPICCFYFMYCYIVFCSFF